MKTRKELWLELSVKYGNFSVNDFIKKCFVVALANKDFFFDVLTDAVYVSYTSSSEVE